MKRIIRCLRMSVVVLLLVGATIGATGCLTSRSKIPGVLRADLRSDEVVVVGRFEKTTGHFFLVWGLFPNTSEDMFASDLKAAVIAAGADGAANVRLESFYTPLDAGINIVSWGFLVPRSYRLRADLVRVRSARLKGRPVLGSERKSP